MAQNPYLDPNSQEILGLQRQQKLADLLSQRGMEMPEQQIISGRVVPINPLQSLVPMLNAYQGRKMSENVEQKGQQLANMLRGQKSEAVNQFTTLMQTDPQKAYQFAANSQIPELNTVGFKGIMPSEFNLNQGEQRFRTMGGVTKPMASVPPKPELPPSSVREYEFAKTQGYKGSFDDYQTMDANRKRAVTNVTTTIPTAENKYSQTIGEGLGKSDLGLYDVAKNAPNVLANIKVQKDILNSGKVYTGAGADLKLDLARFGQALGASGKDTNEIITNTTQLMAGRASSTLDAVKSSGLGAGSGFSNADRDFLEKAKLGGIKYDKAAIERQLEIEEKVARLSVNNWNERLKTMPKSALSANPQSVNLPPEANGTVINRRPAP